MCLYIRELCFKSTGSGSVGQEDLIYFHEKLKDITVHWVLCTLSELWFHGYQ